MNQHRALVIFPGALGDFICFLPALDWVVERYAVDLLARTEFAELVPNTVQVASLERFEIRNLFVCGGASEDRVRRFFESYQFTYSWSGSGQKVFQKQLMSVTHGNARLLPFRPAAAGIHQADYYLSCLTNSSQTRMPHVDPPAAAAKWAKDYWERNLPDRKPVLALAPGSGAREKNWPVAYFQAVAEWWRERFGGTVLTILGPVEEERGDYGSLCRGSHVMTGASLGQLAASLARCTLYIGNDSGTSHLAAAVGVPTVAIFGPSDAVQWAPRGKNVSVMTQSVPCSPCSVPVMKACLHRNCLTAFEARELIRKVERLPAVSKLDKVGGRDYSTF